MMAAALAAIAALSAPPVAGGTPMTWTPARASLAAQLTGKPGAYALLRLGTAQDPVDVGIEWPTPQRIGSLAVRFASLGGRVYEPSLAGQCVQVRAKTGWRAVPASLEVDYTDTGALAPLQGRGTARWTYRFESVEAEAVRVLAMAPAHADPGYQCIAVASIEAGPSVAGPAGPGLTVRGRAPAAPAWLEPGANLAVPEAGAQTRRGNPTTVRWPKPLMMSSVRMSGKGCHVVGVEWLAGDEWRPVDRLAGAPAGEERFRPVATRGLRVRTAGGAAGDVVATLDRSAAIYFDAARQCRADLLGERFRSEGRRDLAAMEGLLLPIDFAKVAIGRPADVLETMVTWTGTFLQVEQSECVDPRTGASLGVQAVDRWFAPAAGVARERFGDRWMAVQSRYLDGWRPAVVTAYEAAGVRFEQTLFVTAPGGPYGTLARVSVTNATRHPAHTAFTYAMGRRRIYSVQGEPSSPFVSDPLPTGYRLGADSRTVRNAAGEVVLYAMQPGRWEGTGREAHLVVPLDLAGGETRELVFFAPCVQEPLRDISALRGLRAADLLAAFRRYWDGFLEGAAALDLPEAPLNDAYRNMLAQCAIIGLDGDVARYGAYAYESYFGVEEGWPAVALAQYGLDDYARRIADYMLSPEALDKRNYHHQYRNGLAPWYAVTIARLTGDTAWLRRIAPTLQQCADWTIGATAANKDARYGGVLPRHVYGGDVGMPAYSFYSNATCWRGMLDTSIALGTLGDREGARRLREAADTYHARLMELADQLVDKSTSVPFLPMAFDLGQGAGARDREPPYAVLASETPSSDTWGYVANYWNLFAPMLLEVRLFREGDARRRWIPAFMEQRGGVLTGLARFSLGLDCIYGKGYMESLLEDGRREEFLTALYGLLANGTSRNLWSFPEVSGIFPLRTDNLALYREHARERWNWMYRGVGAWIAGWQNQEGEPLSAGPGMALQLLRMALVREDYASDPPTRLRILDGAPSHWFAPGKHLAARGLRTFFGPVSVTVECGARSARAVLNLAERRGGLAEVVLRVPSAEGRPIRAVDVRGADVMGFAGDTVTLTRPRAHVVVTARY